MAGEHLDISSEATVPGDASPTPRGQRFVGVHFACCDVYSRIYLNREGSGYHGHCPRCSRRIRIAVGPGGTDSRFFTAY